MNIEQLSKLIQLSVRKALKEELKSFKAEIISEIKKSGIQSELRLDENKNIHKKFREQYRVQQQPKKKLSNDSFLNSILENTQPLEDPYEGFEDELEEEMEIVNVPTSETGRPIQAPKAVLEAMNKDYSSYVEAMEKPKQKVQVQKQPVNPELRSKILSRMEVEDGFDEDEDFSFLDNLK